MDNAILKKRFNTFKTNGGHLKKVSDELLLDFIRAYELWPGKAAEFYRDIGISKQQFSALMKKAKFLCREGRHPESGEFQEIALAQLNGVTGMSQQCQGIELVMGTGDQGKLIRFPAVDPLIEFLKKAA